MKKGFTLIELLAVIVILAIIALIAVPIVLNIRNSSRSSATVVSANFYVNAVEQAISKRNMNLNKLFVPNKCDVAADGTGNITCDDISFEVEIDGEKPIGGTLIYENGNLKNAYIEYEKRTIVMNSEKKLVVLDDIICAPVTEATTGNIPSGNLQPGDEYECEVKEGTKYNFFVLNTTENEVNLIMDRNIGKNDVSIDSDTKTGLVGWYTPLADNSYGPVTAMNYLHDATKDWNNVPNIKIEYTDENLSGSNVSYEDGYGAITTINNKTIIKSKPRDGSSVTEVTYENLKARLPYYYEIYATGCLYGAAGSCEEWISNYLWTVNQYGYWLLTSYRNSSNSNAFFVHVDRKISFTGVQKTNHIGVRPVISIPKTNIY